MPIRDDLQTIFFFSDVLRPGQLDLLAREGRAREYRIGEPLMRQGEPSDSMFCLIEGEVSVVFRDPHGHKTEVIRLRQGSVVGEMEILASEKRLATVSAISDVKAIEIPKSAIQNLVADAPDLAEAFRATVKSRHSIYSIVAHRRPSLLQKLARFFSGRKD